MKWIPPDTHHPIPIVMEHIQCLETNLPNILVKENTVLYEAVYLHIE